MEREEIEEMERTSTDREYVLNAVSKKGKLLEFADEKFKDDEEIVKTALTNDGEALEFVSNRLKGDKRFMFNCYKKCSLDCVLCI